MAKLVFKLRSVSEEEAEGVRQTLRAEGIEFYETSAGTWGWSLPAIWITHDDEYVTARQAIDKFQDSYVKQIREEGPASAPNFLKIAVALVLSAGVIFILNYVWLRHWL